jgi:hypothetical protein
VALRPFRQRDTGSVRADVPGNARQDVEPRGRMQRQADIAGRKPLRAGNGQCERRLAEFSRVEAEEQVVHDRIADEHCLQDVAACDATLAGHPIDQCFDGTAHGNGECLAAIGVHHHVGDAAHQVFAEPDLRVRGAGRRHGATARQVHEMARDCGRADVAGDTEQPLVAVRAQVEQQGWAVAIMMDNGRHIEVRFAQDPLDAWQQGDIAQGPLQPVSRHQSCNQPVGIAERLVHIGFVDLDGIEPQRWVCLDCARLRALAYDLALDRHVDRHIDDDVALDPGLARQPAICRQGTFRGVAHLDLVDRGQVLDPALDAVLGKMPDRGQHLAASADAAATTHALDKYAQRAGRFEDRRADGKTSAPAARHEQDERVLGAC